MIHRIKVFVMIHFMKMKGPISEKKKVQREKMREHKCVDTYNMYTFKFYKD